MEPTSPCEIDMSGENQSFSRLLWSSLNRLGGKGTHPPSKEKLRRPFTDAGCRKQVREETPLLWYIIYDSFKKVVPWEKYSVKSKAGTPLPPFVCVWRGGEGERGGGGLGSGGDKNTITLLETETKTNVAVFVFEINFHQGMKKQSRLSKPPQNKKTKQQPKENFFEVSLFPPPKYRIQKMTVKITSHINHAGAIIWSPSQHPAPPSLASNPMPAFREHLWGPFPSIIYFIIWLATQFAPLHVSGLHMQVLSFHRMDSGFQQTCTLHVHSIATCFRASLKSAYNRENLFAVYW